MKILVTGAAGFIGFHLIKRILADSHDVVGIDNLNDYYDPSLKIARLKELGINAEQMSMGSWSSNEEKTFTFIRNDIDDHKTFDVLKGIKFDAICHLAAQAGVRYSIENPQQYISTNIQGFFNMLEFCRYNPTEHLVFASSSSIYGKNSSVPYRESDKTDSPMSLYAATKKSNELLAYSYSSLYGIRATGLRFFTVYGPWGRPDMAPFLFTSAVIEGKPINVFNNGKLSRDFTYVDDIAEGTYRVLISERKPNDNVFHIYNIGNSTPVNLGDFIATIERLTKTVAHKNMLPMQPGDVETTWADVSLLRHDFGYAPHTSLDTGLKAFVDWYKKFYKK
ncbi:MAG: NAD-dependent epimerase/dehydratase family protein [Rikenellaceae bacterium]